MAFQVNMDECISCGACEEVCPISCITEMNEKRFINEEECISCGSCANICPVSCIDSQD